MKQKRAADIVFFGAMGDLTKRKLLPALYNAFLAGSLHPEDKIICASLEDITREEYISTALDFSKKERTSADYSKIKEFSQLIDYVQMDLTNPEDFLKLNSLLDKNKINVFYFSTAPILFKDICKNLAYAKLNYENARIVLEKPLGKDLDSCRDINQYVAQFFTEKQTYRIDHYLGKESVQNLMALRFGNTLFESMWNRQWIESVQITISESLGLEGRGEFYDKVGALRDMLQNHLLQMLCFVAMEPPASLEADVVRDEKLKVLRSLCPLSKNDILQNVVRGQYKAGAINGTAVAGYTEELNVSPNSNTETFVAIKTEIKNWRWAGVPFYLRTGKRMQEKLAEIVIQFKDVPVHVFPYSLSNNANRLIIRIQPEETVKLYFLAKEPGVGNNLKPVYLDLDFAKMFNAKRMSGYERLLLDVIKGDLGLFVRYDEQMAAWNWVTPILDVWEELQVPPKQYSAGTWGPSNSSGLLARYDSAWHEEME